MNFLKRRILGNTFLHKEKKHNESHFIFSLIKKLEKKEAMLKNLLKSLNTEKEHNTLRLEFIAHLTHEIKTPLNAIIGFASLMEEKELSREKQIKFCKNIISASNHLLNITEATIDTSRAAADKMTLMYSEFSPQASILEVLSVLEEQILKKEIKLITNFECGILMADQRRFKQLIFNLVSNAIKYNKFGGTIKISTQTNNNVFKFEITDTGCGIPQKRKSFIFDYFSGPSKNETSKNESTGIGLSLCKKIVTLHKGTINFRSQEDIGSTFWFTIPTHPSFCINKSQKIEKIQKTL